MSRNHAAGPCACVSDRPSEPQAPRATGRRNWQVTLPFPVMKRGDLWKMWDFSDSDLKRLKVKSDVF